ncbi:MAG: DUF4249 domain-containing protein [Parabacteroides sp.]
MNRIYSSLLPFLLVSLFFSLVSCTEDITLNTYDSDPVMVIYGTVTDQPIHQEIKLSKSTGYFDQNHNTKISGATVTITTGSGAVYDLQEDASQPGVYKTIDVLTGVPGESYHLKVQIDFNGDGVPETYEADATMPAKVALDSLTVVNEALVGYSFYSFNLYAQEPQGENYYLCQYQINDTLYSKLSQYTLLNDVTIENQYINGLSCNYLPDAAERHKYKDNTNYDIMVFVTEGDKIKLSFSNISKGYYNFVQQCQENKDGENPFFGGPFSNITTNISGGGVGYFTAFAIDEKEAIATK